MTNIAIFSHYKFLPTLECSLQDYAQETLENLSQFDRNLVSIDDFDIGPQIDSGTQGNIFRATQKSTNKQCVLKIINIKYHTFEKYYVQEIKIFSQTKNKFLLRLVGFTNKSPYAIATEFVPNGNIYSALNKNEITLTGTQKTLIAIGIASGMNVLHSKGIIHRDLKSSNILLDQQFLPVICDFGVSSFLEAIPKQIMTNVGTPNYMAPEIQLNQEYDTSVDVYSYGVLMWELLFQLLPFNNMDKEEIYQFVVIERRSLPFPKRDKSGLRKIIEQCLSQNPDDRPTFEQIIEKFRFSGNWFDDTDVQTIRCFYKYLQILDQPFSTEEYPKFIFPSPKQKINFQPSLSQLSDLNLLLRDEIPMLKPMYYEDSSNSNDFEVSDQLVLVHNYLNSIKSSMVFVKNIYDDHLLSNFFPLHKSIVPPFVSLLSLIIDIQVDESLMDSFNEVVDYSSSYPNESLHLFSKLANKAPSFVSLHSIFVPIYKFLNTNEQIKVYLCICYLLIQKGKFISRKIFENSIQKFFSLENEEITFYVYNLLFQIDFPVSIASISFHLLNEKYFSLALSYLSKLHEFPLYPNLIPNLILIVKKHLLPQYLLCLIGQRFEGMKIILRQLDPDWTSPDLPKFCFFYEFFLG